MLLADNRGAPGSLVGNATGSRTMDSNEGVRSDPGLNRGDAHAALVVSIQSVVWTVGSSTAAIALGITENSAVLVAFGAIGCVDAIGSLALVHHFGHGLRNDGLSDHLEMVAHRVVLVGLFAVGCAAIIGGAIRLASGQSGEGATPAVLLAIVSLIALIVLAQRKRAIARRISSNALLSDAHLSSIGAAQAAVALIGIATTEWFGWEFADAVATIIVGSVAVSLAIRHRPA
jgi:divalent metal cation (Fe/Co/Zn/Cd) transporter